MAISRVRANEAIKTNPLNSVIDQVNTNTTRLGKPFPAIKQGGNLIFAINNTGEDLRFGDVAAFFIDETVPSFYDDDPTKMEATGTRVILREPTEEDSGNFCVCANTIAVDQGGFVYESGVVIARVQAAAGSDDSFEYCDIDTDMVDGIPTVLKMSAGGSARILQTLSETDTYDENWCLIRFPIISIDGTFEYPFYIGKDDQGNLITTEGANQLDWDRDYEEKRSGEVTDGVQITVCTRVEYKPDGDEILYKYTRDLTFDSNGLLRLSSNETRSTIDTPEEC